jgi:amidohydrolase
MPPRTLTETLQLVNGWEPAVDQHIAGLEPRLIDIRRHLHAHPEASREERETSQYLCERLHEAGIAARLAREGLGVLADVDVGRPADDAPRIAIRAAIDALRIQDEKTTPYASQNPGLCHACGHDAHAAIVLGTALCGAALRFSDQAFAGGLPGLRLRFIFQPAEESSDGGAWMVEQGAVDDVAAILGVHVDPERKLGTVGIRYGILTANCDEVQITIEGQGGHAARPHQTRDPITALYQYLPRSIDSRSPAVFSIGKLSGGTLSNVIPSRVEVLGSLRTLERATREKLKDRIEAIVHGVKEASGTAIHVRFYESIDSVVNDPRVTGALEVAARRVLGSEGIEHIHEASMGGEDFSAYLTRVPGAMLRVGIAPPGFAAPFLHAPDFDIDERALALGARILLRAALILSADPPAIRD